VKQVEVDYYTDAIRINAGAGVGGGGDGDEKRRFKLLRSCGHESAVAGPYTWLMRGRMEMCWVRFAGGRLQEDQVFTN